MIKRIINMKRFSNCFDLVLAIYHLFSIWHCCFFIIWLRFRIPSPIRCVGRHPDFKTVECLLKEVLDTAIQVWFDSGSIVACERHGNLLMVHNTYITL